MRNFNEAENLQNMWAHYGVTPMNYIDYILIGLVTAVIISLLTMFIVKWFMTRKHPDTKQKLLTRRYIFIIVSTLIAVIVITGLDSFGSKVHNAIQFKQPMSELNVNVNLDETRKSTKYDKKEARLNYSFYNRINHAIQHHQVKNGHLELAKRERSRYLKNYDYYKSDIEIGRQDLKTHHYYNVGRPNLFKAAHYLHVDTEK